MTRDLTPNSPTGAKMMARRYIGQFAGRHAFLANDWHCDVALNKRLFDNVDQAYAFGAPTDNIRLDVMRECVRSKFLRNTQLGLSLLATRGYELFNGNTNTRYVDQFWGVDILTLEGENHLGLILMDIRTAIALERFYEGE